MPAPYTVTAVTGNLMIPGQSAPLQKGQSVQVSSIGVALAAAISDGYATCSAFPAKGTTTTFTALTDNTGGTANRSTALVAFNSTFSNTELKNAVATLASAINLLITGLERAQNDIAAIQAWIAQSEVRGMPPL